MTSSAYLSGIANRVRSERENQDLSQRKMAEMAGISFRAYQQFEATGNTSLRRLALILGVLGREADLLAILSRKTRFSSLDEFEKSTPAAEETTNP
jgi:transcriptional regulator with XRE-family HTH domain